MPLQNRLFLSTKKHTEFFGFRFEIIVDNRRVLSEVKDLLQFLAVANSPNRHNAVKLVQETERNRDIRDDTAV